MKNLAYAQPVKDWFLATFKCTIDLLAEKIQAGLVTVIWAYLPIIWGPVYKWFRLGLKEFHRKPLEAHPLPVDESPKVPPNRPRN